MALHFAGGDVPVSLVCPACETPGGGVQWMRSAGGSREGAAQGIKAAQRGLASEYQGTCENLLGVVFRCATCGFESAGVLWRRSKVLYSFVATFFLAVAAAAVANSPIATLAWVVAALAATAFFAGVGYVVVSSIAYPQRLARARRALDGEPARRVRQPELWAALIVGLVVAGVTFPAATLRFRASSKRYANAVRDLEQAKTVEALHGFLVLYQRRRNHPHYDAKTDRLVLREAIPKLDRLRFEAATRENTMQAFRAYKSPRKYPKEYCEFARDADAAITRLAREAREGK